MLLFSVIAAPPALSVLAISELPVNATAPPSVIAPVAVKLRLPVPVARLAVKLRAPPAFRITLPPPLMLLAPTAKPVEFDTETSFATLFVNVSVESVVSNGVPADPMPLPAIAFSVFA